jgi:putative ABC transport system permease protein
MRQLPGALSLAARRLLRRPLAAAPSIAVIALTTLGLGLVLSLVQGVLLRPLPYAEPERLVQPSWQTHPDHRSPMALTEAAALYLREQKDLFAAQSVYGEAGMQVAIGRGESAHTAPAVRADAGLLPTLGLTPQRGRAPSVQENAAGLPQVLVSQALWRRHFGPVAEFAPARLEIEGVPHEVLGVLPAGFSFDPPVELILPWQPGGAGAQGHNARVIARLADGAEADVTQALLDARAAEHIAGFNGASGAGTAPRIRLIDLKSVVVGQAGSLLLPLAAAVALLALMAAFNLANLQIAALLSRRDESAVRGALGAQRWMLWLPSVVESGLHLLLGFALGVAGAAWLLPQLLSWLPVDLPRLAGLGLDAASFGWIGASAVLMLGLSLLIAVLGERMSAQALRSHGRGSRRLGLQPLLVSAQVALSAVLLAGCLMAISSLDRLLDAPAGFAVEGVQVVELVLPEAEFGHPSNAAERTSRYLQGLTEALAGLPGVQTVASTSSPPLSRGLNNFVTARGTAAGEAGASVELRVVSPGYLDALSAGLLAGRDFLDSDSAKAPKVAIVNQAYAAAFLPAGAEIGARLDMDGVGYEVVGVSADLREQSLREPALPTVLLAQAQMAPDLQAAINRWFGARLLVRGVDAAALEPALRAALRRIPGEAVMQRLRPLAELQAASLANERLVSALLGGFALLALSLAALGLYALLEHLRRQRERELAVRLALGAHPQQNARLLLGGSLKLTAFGLGAGALGAWALARGIAHLLFGGEAVVLQSIGAALLAVLMLSLLAALLPLRATLRLAPATALRGD